MSVVALAFAGVAVVGLPLTGIVVQPGQLISKALLCLSLLLVAAFYRWRREEKLVGMIMMAFWTITFGTLHLFPMFIASRSRVGLSDAVLAGFDRAMGLELPRILETMGQVPLLSAFLTYCYGLLILLMVLAVILPPLCGKMQAAKEFSIASVVSAVVSLPVFAVFQAVGPWAYYGYRPLIDQTAYMSLFSELRSHHVLTLDLSYGDGLISFPSFHTILAVLAAAVLRDIRFVRWPAACLGTLIVISTMTTGSHYVVDVVAGLVVAAGAHYAARVYSRVEQAMERRSAEALYSAAGILQPI
jgi:hypothetical protein